ncbi:MULTISPECIES: tyrosine-type recombinase/integrase [unclassified Streptomyces]|uniref:tyrosine-type recombinase/integrase n=1 Tax=unclassified Streptomyces TaxID=2593676 RepID=UPI00073BA8A2|nr:tyrosine-type recombinase/integrase [Streptomyces sp. AVP053U2]ODA69731.1 Tyrosine recombinase XerC [Streptomyces sp. AVP053U2]
MFAADRPTAEILRVEVTDTLAYWTVLAGPTLRVVEDVDGFLRHLRFGRTRAESTTKAYAGHLKRFHAWCDEQGLSREHAAAELPHYLMKLRTTPRLTSGRSQGQLPQDSTLAPALAAIHGFYQHLADLRRISAKAVDALFVTAPHPAAGKLVLEPRIRVDPRPSHASGRAPAASHEEFAALLRATKTARDRCIVALLGACALRVGQVVGLLREDIHLVPVGSTVPGCPYSLGPHLHLEKRDGHPRGAANKSRGTVVVPVPEPVVMLYADWMRERLTIPRAGKSSWAFVSFPGPTGEPGGQVLGTRRVQDLVSDLARDAGIRHIHPHMLRHTFGETAADLDVARDVLQRLLGHRDVASQNVYRNPSDARVAHAARAVNDKIFGPA